MALKNGLGVYLSTFSGGRFLKKIQCKRKFLKKSEKRKWHLEKGSQKKETPVLGNSIPVLVMKLKPG